MNSKLSILQQRGHSSGHLSLLSRQRGLSLVELMIAMTLGLFLIWGVTQSFLTSRQVYDMQGALSQVQENTRLAQEFMAYDIRNAGDYGCSSGDRFVLGAADIRNDTAANCAAGTYPALTTTTGINMITATSSVDDEFQYAVYGFDTMSGANGNLAIGVAGAILSPTPKANTDVLMVHTATEIGVLSASIPNGPNVTDYPPTLVSGINSLTLATGSPIALPATDRIAVSDCATTKIFGLGAAVATGDTAITLGTNNYCRTAAFAVGTSVRKLSTTYYYVATKLDGTSSLYRAEGNNSGTLVTGSELLEGVEDLQLEFGVDNNGDGDIDIYKDWSDAAHTPSAADWNGWDWVDEPTLADHPDVNSVRAVRYHLLMSAGGANLMADDQQRAMFFGKEYVGGIALPATTGRDRKLRQVVSSTVGIRSRVR